MVPSQLSTILTESILTKGLDETADQVMMIDGLVDKIVEKAMHKVHLQLKNSLKKSIQTSRTKKKRRDYLLSLSPLILCKELCDTAPDTFNIIIKLLGIADTNEVFEQQHITNLVAILYAAISKHINREASGFCLFLTTILRDGGLREDSMRILNYILCDPRTAQRYDTDVLAKDWDADLCNILEGEQRHYDELREAEKVLDTMIDDSPQEITVAVNDIKALKAKIPPQVCRNSIGNFKPR